MPDLLIGLPRVGVRPRRKGQAVPIETVDNVRVHFFRKRLPMPLSRTQDPLDEILAADQRRET